MEKKPKRVDSAVSELITTLTLAKSVVVALLVLGCGSCARRDKVANAQTPSERSPASQSGKIVRYYCDHAGNLVESTNGGPPALVADPLSFAAGSGNGEIDYAIEYGEKSLKVFRCSADGSLVDTREVTDERISNVGHLNALVILPNGHVFIDGHINPSLSLGIDVGGAPGEDRCFLGDNFTWNGTASRVAYFRDPPHFGPPEMPAEIRVNGRALREIPRWSGKSITWEADGHTLDVEIENGPPIRIDTNTAPAIDSELES